MYKKINKCRICGNRDLVPVLDLGRQHLTGVFPKTKEQPVSRVPLELVKCNEARGGESCGLLQLRHTHNLKEMYGKDYGYRSGLNQTMVAHLRHIVSNILNTVKLGAGDLILDIGSNDGTLLLSYPKKGAVLAGIDPAGKQFNKYYPARLTLLPDFFSSGLIKEKFKGKKPRVITSIAMFYDLESPMDFMKQIYDILSDDGIWVFEQSYMPFMLKTNSYDTICHEHLEYYGFRQIKWMTDRAGFKIIDVEFNNINGGSFCLTAAKADSRFRENKKNIEKTIKKELGNNLNGLKPYKEFSHRVYRHKDDLKKYIVKIKSNNKLIIGYGASTKGNVILQFCGLTEKEIPFIAEVNKDKFGCYTPGTLIPIIPEEEARALNPDYFMVLPWHFRENIIKRERSFLEKKGRLLMPLPRIEFIDKYKLR